MNTTLPIDAHLEEVDEALRDSGAAVILAPPGAGKTTRIPPHILRSGSAGEGRIIVLEPRRVAARAAAARMAEENGWRLGEQVGYQVRLERKASTGTRILVVTEGILVRILADDPLLPGVSCVLVDEFHERSVHADLSLAMLRHVKREVRPDLKILVMSATMDPDPVSRFLGGCAVIRVAARPFPVDVEYRSGPAGRSLPETVARAVHEVLHRTPGDVLVFLPGVGEIGSAARLLQRRDLPGDPSVMQLYGNMSPRDQDAVLKPATSRKVVLATNVAETSVTIEGVSAVVDSGLARTPSFDPAVGLDRLELGRISRASAAQRAGRAGRGGPGLCIRLYTRADHDFMAEAREPEISRTDVASPVLTLLAWGEDPERFGWFQPPGQPALRRAVRLLELLGAMERGRLTPLGRAMASIPLHPRLARLVIEGHSRGHLRAAAGAAALLSERDPVRRTGTRGADGPRARSSSDVLDRLTLIEDEKGREAPHLDRSILDRLRSTGRMLAREAEHRLGPCPPGGEDGDEALLRSLLAAYPDRLAKRREAGSARALMVGGRGVRLSNESAVVDHELFVCVELQAGRRGLRSEAVVHMASGVQGSWLPDDAVTRKTSVTFDHGLARVVAREQTLFLDLLLDERPSTSPDPEQVASVLADALSKDPVGMMGLSEDPVKSFLARVRFLATHVPELGIEPVDEVRIRGMLPGLCTGRSTLSELTGKSLLALLMAMLTPGQLRDLDAHAPSRLKLPGGRSAVLDYSQDGPPVLAARIQELFGTSVTPLVGRGRVPVMLHILAPNMRPQQITQDLGSFWKNTYPQVRKELRSRYPRHHWPEDPLQAVPRSRPGGRRTREGRR